MSESEEVTLYQKAQTIDLNRVGGIGGLESQYPDNHETLLRYLVAQAMLSGIGGGLTETGYYVRELRPSDFHTGWDSLVYYNWVQDIHSSKVKSDGNHIYSAYKTHNPFNKVFYIYALEKSFDSQVAQIEFWEEGVKLLQVINISDDYKTEFRLKTPMWFRPKDYWHPSEEQKKKFKETFKYEHGEYPKGFEIIYILKDRQQITKSYKEHIKFLGFVCETVGSTCISD